MKSTDPGALWITTSSGAHLVTPEDGAVQIGSDPRCRIMVNDPRVCAQHLELRHKPDGWHLFDLDSRSGTYSGTRRIEEVRFTRTCRVRLGGVTGPLIVLRTATVTPPGPSSTSSSGSRPGPAGAATADATSAPDRAPSATDQATARTKIGRAGENDIVLTDLQVSQFHAKLVRTPVELRLIDLGTLSGSFVNGRRVDSAPVQAGDVLSFGRHRLVFDGTQLREHVDTGHASLRAERLTVTVAGRQRLLDDVSFELDKGSLLAVVGPSGAGKSTLLGALTGYRPATRGRVAYEGRDLYAEYDELRHRIGLVPQDDILHSALTVRRALRYAAALRFGPDVTAAERDQRIDEVIAQLGLTDQAEQRVDTLSGGQRKRTSVALELLTEPSLLFLDEPTSGLDPALDRDVMVSLRDLADRGRTVVVVTHSPLHLDVCDRVLVLGRGGRVAYFGPPVGLLAYFGAAGYADVFKSVDEQPEHWAARHARTRPTVTPPLTPGSPASAGPGPEPAPPRTTSSSPTTAPAVAPATIDPVVTAAPPTWQSWWRQVSVLSRRMAAVILTDRTYTALLLGLPLGLAVLLQLIPGDDGFARPTTVAGRSPEASQLLVVLIIGAVFIGLSGGIRELVGERAIYRRERAVGLSPGAYLGAKLLVFALVNAVQAVLFAVLGMLGRPGPTQATTLGLPMLELIVVVWLTAIVSTAAGLLVSAYVSTIEQTMPILVGLVMAQLVLCGGLFSVAGRAGIEQFSWLAPARWGYAAAAATVDLRTLMVSPSIDALWRHTSGAWWWAVGVLVLQIATLAGLTRWALHRQEPGMPSRSGRKPAAARDTGKRRVRVRRARVPNNNNAQLQPVLQAGWNSACQLYEHLHQGGKLVALPETVRLDPDEACYADAIVGYASYYGTTPIYEPYSSLLFDRANSRAMAPAAVRWRDHTSVRTILTSRRLLCEFHGRWQSFWHEGVVGLEGDTGQWLFVLRYQAGPPIMLHGPSAPWYAVAVAHLRYGQRGLQLPALAPVARRVTDAIKQRQR